MVEFTNSEQKKSFKKKATLKIDDILEIEFKPEDAVLLSPSLGMPAVVKKEDDCTAILELILLAKSDKLQQGNVAFHLRMSLWNEKDTTNDIVSNNKIFETYWYDKSTVNISKPVRASADNFGNGLTGADRNDANFKLKLAHLNIFPWILDRLSSYAYLYKVSVNLKDYQPGLYNIWWVNKKDYIELKNRPKWWNLVQHAKDLVSKDYKKELKEYGGGVTGKENVQASIYHPVYITKKKELNIGHVTDVHLDSRMNIYSQSIASVIEVKENCEGGITFDDRDRNVKNKDWYNPIKDIFINFNKLFTELCTRLFDNGSDIIVITGDLIDYNRSIHTPQTFRESPEKPSIAWDNLNRDYYQHALNKDKMNDDRNWFLFYEKLLELYDKKQKPIITILGNHDYVNFGVCPWPLGGGLWDGVYDQNLTRYESALMFGPGYKNSKEFISDLKERTDFVKWYTFFINPFPDFVVEYGDQSLFMVDWATNSSVFGAYAEGAGALNHAKNLFRENSDFQMSHGGYKSETADSSKPFEIRNYTIYQSWIKSKPPIKMLFMHATAICPRDDVSIGEINFSYKWTDDKLRYGTFDSRREEIIRDVETGDLGIIVSGHSHRNVVMEVKESHKGYAFTRAKEEHVNTEFMEPKHVIMVSSSGGPLPKYLPGAPYICACDDGPNRPNKYKTGFFYEKSTFSKNKLFRYEEGISRPSLISEESSINHNCLKAYIDDGKCPDCGMSASDMVKKPPRRHRPGGNILFFENGKVKIKSIFSEIKQSKPRKGPLCEKQGVFVDEMMLEGIKSEIKFNNWKHKIPINIISKNPFKYYGNMEFPSRVQYVTFSEGELDGGGRVRIEPSEKPYEKIVKQDIVKDSFEGFKDSAKHKEDFAFTRYYFGLNDIWDREINISKHFLAKAQDWAQKRRTDIINTAEFFSSYDPEYEKTHIDEFDGMIIEFRTIPDFEKRKNPHVCGY
ncbi:MAG: metallophosphoesterase [Proteobacteria bacterium]|nr:metallophosphoesterase [Pseudomonadota bacterium]